MKETFLSILAGICKAIGRVSKFILIIILILIGILVVNTFGLAHMLLC